MTQGTQGNTMLGGYRVLDLTSDRGYYCGQLLGNLGADVIKIEPPGGDPGRNTEPFFRDQAHPEKSFFWMAFNTNKRGITLNLETEDGRRLFRRLAEKADVVVESFDPGYLDALSLGYAELEKLNPRLVFTSITPFGQTGPRRDFKSSDLVAWGMGGLLFQTGDPDRPPTHLSHIPLAYLLAGMDGASGTAIALYWRATSGLGQQVDVSMQETVAKTTMMLHEVWLVTGTEFRRSSSWYHVPASPVVLRLVWPAKDGYIFYMMYVGAFGAEEDKRLVQWMQEEGIADDFIRGIDWANLDWREKTKEYGDRIQDYLFRLFKDKTKAELLEQALKRNILIQPISTPKDILTHPQFVAREYWQEVKHDELGMTMKYPARFCMASETPLRISRRAPVIGEHNEEVYCGELGLSRGDLVALKQAGII